MSSSPPHKHPQVWHIPVQCANTRCLKDPSLVMLDEGFEQERYFRVDFGSNTERLLKAARDYVINENEGRDVNSDTLKDIGRWFSCQSPFYMCRGGTTRFIFNTRGLYSRQFLKTLLYDERVITDCLFSDLYFQSLTVIRSVDGERFNNFKKYVQFLVREKRTRMLNGEFSSDREREAVKKFRLKVRGCVRHFTDDDAKEMDECRRNSRLSSDEERRVNGAVETMVKSVFEFSIKTSDDKELNPKGKGFVLGEEYDKYLETDFTQFCIVGPHNGHNGDCDCAIIFRKEIMHHLDFYMLPLSAIVYFTKLYPGFDPEYFAQLWKGIHGPRPSEKEGEVGERDEEVDDDDDDDDDKEEEEEEEERKKKKKNVHEMEEEDGDDKEIGSEERMNRAREAINDGKLSPAIPGWEEAMAYLWISRVHATKKTPISDITLRHVKELWNEADPCFVTEGHLPQAIPLHYISKIVLKRSVYEELWENIPDEEIWKDTPDEGEGEKKSVRRDMSCGPVLEWFRDVNKDSIVVVDSDDPEDVKAKVRELCEEDGVDAYTPSGFTFNLSRNEVGKEIPIPSQLAINDNHIYFTATRGRFTMILSNIPDYFSSVNNRFCLIFQFNNPGVSVFFSRSMDNDDVTSDLSETRPKLLVESPNFDRGVVESDEEEIHYHLFFPSDQSYFTLLHSGGSLLCDESVCYVGFDEKIKPLLKPGDEVDWDMRYALFSANEHTSEDVSIWDFCILDNPLPEPIPLPPLEPPPKSKM